MHIVLQTIMNPCQKLNLILLCVCTHAQWATWHLITSFTSLTYSNFLKSVLVQSYTHAIVNFGFQFISAFLSKQWSQ